MLFRLLAALAVGSAMLAVPPMSAAQGPYEIVRGKDLAVCRALVKNFNLFKDQPPMVCERRVHPDSKGLAVPDWKAMSGDSALMAALALEKAIASMGSASQFQARYAKAEALVRSNWSGGRLKVWESRLDLAGRGQAVRVVLVRKGECQVKRNDSAGDPIIGVLSDDKLEVNSEYQSLAHIDGDLIVYEGRPYLVNWEAFPTATRRGPQIAKRHRGYADVSTFFWLPARGGGPAAGRSDPVCQIGYERLAHKR